MEIASCWVYVNKNGNVPKAFITPAELVLLVKELQPIIGRFPVHNLQVFKEIDNKDLAAIEDKGEREFAKLKERQRRSFLNQDPEQERQRLKQKYGQPPGAKNNVFKVDIHLGSGFGNIPNTFEELGLMFKQAQVSGLTEEIVPMPSDDNLPPMPEDDSQKETTPVEAEVKA